VSESWPNPATWGGLVGDLAVHSPAPSMVVSRTQLTPFAMTSLIESRPGMPWEPINGVWGHAEGFTLERMIQKSINKGLTEETVLAKLARFSKPPTDVGIDSRDIDKEMP
jgi:hypothetical protein